MRSRYADALFLKRINQAYVRNGGFRADYDGEGAKYGLLLALPLRLRFLEGTGCGACRDAEPHT